MFPWLMPNAGLGGQLSLLSMMQGDGQGGQGSQGGYAFGSNPYTDPNYWANASTARQPGQSNWDLFMHGMLPQSVWPQQWKDQQQQGDRSDQSGNQNQPDTGNSMAPPGQTPRGGPDNTSMSGYDPSTVSPGPRAYGYQPANWMRALSGFGGGGARRPNMNQSLAMGALGLSMLQPRQPAHTGPYPWI
jgi:hypothetical protein